MTIAEFFAECESHDWTYNYSDDFGVWSRGDANAKRLRAEAATDATKQEIFDAFREWQFSGPAFGNDRAPRPELSNYA